jgi:hypothetical protein
MVGEFIQPGQRRIAPIVFVKGRGGEYVEGQGGRKVNTMPVDEMALAV